MEDDLTMVTMVRLKLVLRNMKGEWYLRIFLNSLLLSVSVKAISSYHTE